jgi:hypothetical protein
MAKKNVTGKSKAKRTAGTFLRLKPQLKEDAQIWAIKNKMTLTDTIALGLKTIINEDISKAL